ncbi:MAG: bifunctional enoyl-CoA hydratase/phosphate acetyltransferase [candidate division Zixibacteria bacterium]|nr:bifunctional enoyl-CoA hydratase/phosphate acetyltransferase [candidate division Zixibacteria bacterium]
MIKSFKELLDSLKNKERKILAIAGAEGEEIIEAAKIATEQKIISPILIGDPDKIESLCKKSNFDLSRLEILGEKEPQKIASLAVELVKQKKADILMKGKVDTPTLLKAVLDKEKGLKGGKLLSHVAVVEVEKYPKLMLITDGGMNIAPDVMKKIDILKNAIEVSKKLGIEKPKTACLAAVELVNPDMPETIDASIISKMAERGEIKDVIVDGPIAFDVAIDSKSAQTKGIISPVSGETDIFLCPNISSCNILVKGLIYLAEAKVGGIIVGGGAPIVLLSRSDSAEIKLLSIALGAAVS